MPNRETEEHVPAQLQMDRLYETSKIVHGLPGKLCVN